MGDEKDQNEKHCDINQPPGIFRLHNFDTTNNWDGIIEPHEKK
jgi:hypothetical protein